MSEKVDSNGFRKYFDLFNTSFKGKLTGDFFKSQPIGFYLLVLGFLWGLVMLVRSVFLIFG